MKLQKKNSKEIQKENYLSYRKRRKTTFFKILKSKNIKHKNKNSTQVTKNNNIQDIWLYEDVEQYINT